MDSSQSVSPPSAIKRCGNNAKKNVVCFNKDDSDFAVAAEMIRRHFKICPVIDENGIFVGCVSRAYLIRSMILEKNREEKAVLKYE